MLVLVLESVLESVYVSDPSEVAMACNWATERLAREFMTPTLAIPPWILDGVAPALADVANGP